MNARLSSANRIRRRLQDDSWITSLWCVIAACGTYFCMYAFRKPFTAAGYADVDCFSLSFKTILISSQVLGYTLSTFIGIRIIAEMPPQRRAKSILMLIGVAEICLLLFGLAPPRFSFVPLFVNGLSLGMVFGLVLGFLEGRRMTESLTAGLCISFIVADGAAKSLGAYLLSLGISEAFMPCLAGLVSLPPLLVFVGMLALIPPPSARDIACRCRRSPMNAADRRRFFRRFAQGLSLIVAVYLLITILRSIRADFAPEIWKGLGLKVAPGVFAYSEILVGISVLVVNGAFAFIRDNRRAFFAALGISMCGSLFIAAAVLGQLDGRLNGFAFMVLTGIGLYLPYVAIHTTVFERLIAFTRERGNIGYLMYLADAFGYLGYAIVILCKNFEFSSGSFLQFFLVLGSTTAIISAILLVLAWKYFSRHEADSAANESFFDKILLENNEPLTTISLHGATSPLPAEQR